MPTGTFDNPNLASVVVPRVSRPLEMSCLSAPFQLHAGHVDRGGCPSMEWPADAVVEGRAWKGACWALAIEGAAAILIYGMWQFWSIIR
jgi:hypothetical protein